MKKIFSYNSDIDKTAYINWRINRFNPIHNMNVLAQGYFHSVFLLIEECLQDNHDKKADAVIFPIIFSANHAIELYVKSICWSLNILLQNTSIFNTNHDIRGIWFSSKQKIKEYGFDFGREETAFNEMIKPLESYLNELYNKIKSKDINSAYHNIDFSRYPTNNRNEYHFYINEIDNVVIDLENFLEEMHKIYECLRSLAEYYCDLATSDYN